MKHVFYKESYILKRFKSIEIYRRKGKGFNSRRLDGQLKSLYIKRSVKSRYNFLI